MALDLRVGLISDGWPPAQRAKLDALGIERSFASKMLTGDWGGRYGNLITVPSQRWSRSLSLSSSELVYVADNPTKDFIAPNERGWLTWRIRMPGQLHQCPRAQWEHRCAPGLGAISAGHVVAEYQAGTESARLGGAGVSATDIVIRRIVSGRRTISSSGLAGQRGCPCLCAGSPSPESQMRHAATAPVSLARPRQPPIRNHGASSSWPKTSHQFGRPPTRCL